MISPTPLARLTDVGCEDVMVPRPVVVDIDPCWRLPGALQHVLRRSARQGGTDTRVAASCLVATGQPRDVRCTTLVAELSELVGRLAQRQTAFSHT